MSKHDDLKQMPLYQKAEQILKIIIGLVEIVPKENKFMQETTARSRGIAFRAHSN